MKRILSVLLVAVMLLTAAPLSGFVGLDIDFGWLDFSTKSSALSSSGYCGSNVTYTFDSGTGLLTIRGTGAMWDYDWKESPFLSDSSIKSVVINNGVTGICDYGFYECMGITSITIPNSVTSIGDCAFYGCSDLISISIPDSVTSIGSGAFSGCSDLTSITVESNNKVYDSRENCNAIIETKTNTLVQGCEDTTIPNGVTSIGDCAFYGCSGLSNITIPDSVTSIGRGAFEGCSGLTSITIGNSVTSIGSFAFSSCSGLTSITIPDNVTSIGDCAFSGCSGLTSITISDSVTSIGPSAFSGCSGLTSITIPDNVTSIGDCAFSGCSGLKSITIPDNVTSIGDWAFSGCSGLTSITIPDIVTSIGNRTFDGCAGLTSITIPDNITSIGSGAFTGCSSLTSVTIPNSVKSIEDETFVDCTNLTSIIIGNKVTKIGYNAFSNCISLISVTIPDSVNFIASDSFSGCTNLTSIDIGDGVTEIFEGSFGGLQNLEHVTIGSGVTTIGESAFYNCINLKEVVIPYSVSSIGCGAFDCCKKISFYNRDCVIGDDVAKNCYIIYGYIGSTAETYAKNSNDCYFYSLDYSHTAHIYDNDCDKICNLCGAERSVGEHIYDSDCDSECNICGTERIPNHIDKDNDGNCDNCSKHLSDIALSTVKKVAVGERERVYLKFTAPYTGQYTFYSSSNTPVCGGICDSDKNVLVSNFVYSDGNINFSLSTNLIKGTVYYLAVEYLYGVASGTIPVTIDYICDHLSTHTEQKDSTCTECGYEKSVCDICGEIISSTEIPNKQHNYVATVTNPTCTEQGYTTYTCSLCGDSYIDDYTDALNHPQKTWRVTKNPTTTSTGLMAETCDLCGEKTGEMIMPMLIPDYVTGITVSPNRLTLNIGETANLTAVITPDTAENKNVIWSSSDTDIATVADGVVTAKTPGVAMIIVQSEDGGYKDFCVVRVASLTPANGAVVDNENGLIYGISSNSAGINSYVNTVDDTMTVECDSALLGTGSVVNIVKDDVIVDSYKIVLFGDVNGDGWYDGQDAITVSCLANGMLTREQVGEAVWMAADCNHDGVIDQLDVDLLNQAGVLLSSIDQTKTQEELIETSAEYNEYLGLIDQMGSEDTTETPTQDESDSFFTRIIAFIESIIKILNTFFTKIF